MANKKNTTATTSAQKKVKTAAKVAQNREPEVLDTSIEVGYEYKLTEIINNLKEKGLNLSLRKIATSLDINYNMLLKAGKRAQPGKVYNPDVINFDAAEDYIRAKIGGPEEFDAIDFEAMAKEAATSRTSNPAVSIEKFSRDTLLKLRNDDTLYLVNFKNENCLVLVPMANAEEFSPDGKARVFSHATFLHQGPKVADEQFAEHNTNA